MSTSQIRFPTLSSSVRSCLLALLYFLSLYSKSHINLNFSFSITSHFTHCCWYHCVPSSIIPCCFLHYYYYYYYHYYYYNSHTTQLRTVEGVSACYRLPVSRQVRPQQTLHISGNLREKEIFPLKWI